MEALKGIRVLDIATVIAAPWGASLLADFGAEVIKVEMPGRGDAFRAMGPLKDGVSIRWPSMARNKKTITLDFHYEEGKKLFLELVAQSDVIFENFRTGTLEKWGLGMDVLRQANPNIIVTHVTGYGQTGPNAKLSGLGTPLQAFSGMTYMTGYADRPPVSPPFALADYIAGLNAVIGTMIALYQRDALGGKPQEVDVSLYEGIFRMLENVIAKDIYEDEQYQARENIVTVPCEEFGEINMPSVFPVLSETPGQIKWPGAKMGAYNDEIYGELLGKTGDELATLKEKGVI